MEQHPTFTPTRLAAAAAVALALAAPCARADFTNFLGMAFVDIPSGSFYMGSCKESSDLSQENKKRAFLGQAQRSAPCPSGAGTDPDASDVETPQHGVRVGAFQMGRTEVTLGQFKEFIASGHEGLLSDDFMKYNGQGDNAAVTYVSWEDAQAFVAWLNRNKPAGDGGQYRLPSEAEWEYACRADEAYRYCGSDAPGEVAWHDGNSGGRVHPVAAKRPNAWGLYDMSGNVWEWVQDCWHDSYQGAPQNGQAWTSGCKENYRLLRGGSWRNSTKNLRAALRGNISPDGRGDTGGIRVVRAASPRTR